MKNLRKILFNYKNLFQTIYLGKVFLFFLLQIIIEVSINSFVDKVFIFISKRKPVVLLIHFQCDVKSHKFN